jgi:hypothetical protein
LEAKFRGVRANGSDASHRENVTTFPAAIPDEETIIPPPPAAPAIGRSARADAARNPRALIEAMEFAKHGPSLGMRNADAGIVDLNAERAAAAPAAHSTPPAGVYLIALETRFCKSRPNSRRSERTVSAHGMTLRTSPLAPRCLLPGASRLT